MIRLTEHGKDKAVKFVESLTKNSSIYWNSRSELIDDIESSMICNGEQYNKMHIQMHISQTTDGARHRLDFNAIDDYTREVIL